MKSWSELTPEERQAVLRLSLELAKVFDAILDELVPLFECITDILIKEAERQERLRKEVLPYIDGVDIDD